MEKNSIIINNSNKDILIDCECCTCKHKQTCKYLDDMNSFINKMSNQLDTTINNIDNYPKNISNIIFKCMYYDQTTISYYSCLLDNHIDNHNFSITNS